MNLFSIFKDVKLGTGHCFERRLNALLASWWGCASRRVKLYNAHVISVMRNDVESEDKS